MRKRNEIDASMKWDLTPIYPDAAAMETDLADCGAMAEKIAACAGTLSTKEGLAAALGLTFGAMEKLERASCYAYLNYSLDGGNTAAQEMMAKTQNAGVTLMTAMSFMEPEMLTVPEEELKAWLDDPALATYRHYVLDVIRAKAHTLDAKGEAILSQVAKITGTASDTYDMFTDVEMEIPKIELTSGNFGMYRESSCRKVRENAFNTMFGTYKKYNNTFATLYAGNVKKDNMLAAIRGYDSACEAALFAGNVPVSVYDSLVGGVHEALPVMQKYLELRKKVLNLPELDVFDLYCPMTADVEYPMPFASGKELVKKALAPLGEEYAALLDRAFSENWIDVYETPGKASGAYSMGIYGAHPYVLLNYTDTLDDAFTLALHALPLFQHDAGLRESRLQDHGRRGCLHGQ